MTETLCQCGRPAGSAYLCVHCRRTLEFALQRIPEHALDLELVKAKQVRYTEASGGRGVGHTLPLIVDSRFLDRQPDPDSSDGSGTALLDDLEDTLTKWCKDLKAAHPNTRSTRGPVCSVCLHSSCITYRRGRWPNNTTSSMCAYLSGWAGWVSAQAFGPELLDHLLDLERRLAKFVDRPVQRMFVGPCPLCHIGGDDVGLYVLDEHTTEVTCRSCEMTWDVRRRRSWMIADMADRLVSAKDVCRVIESLAGVSLSPTTIRVWAHRGRLGQHTVNGLPRYRVGDVWDLVTTREEQSC